MKRLVLLALFSVLALGPARAEGDKVRLERLLPEKCPMVLMVEDFPLLIERWGKSPFSRAWNDPALMKFLAPMREEMEIDRWDEKCQEATGMKVGEILELFRGQVLIAATDLSAMKGEEAPRPPDVMEVGPDGEMPMPPEPEEDPLADRDNDSPKGGLLILAHIGENREAVEKLTVKGRERTLKEAPAGVEIQDVTEEFQGETIHIRQKSFQGKTVDARQNWAFVNDLFIAAPGKADIQDAIARLKQGGTAPSCADSIPFQKARSASPGSDVLMSVDLEAVMAFAHQEMKREMGDEPNPMMMGVTPDALFTALGLDVLQSASFSLTLGPSATDVRFALQGREQKGLLKLFTASLAGKATQPGFLPQDAATLGSMHFSFKTFWETLEEILNGVSPQLLAMLQMQLQQMTAQTGVDLKKDLFDHLGSEIASAEVLHAREPGKPLTAEDVDKVWVFAVEDRKAVEGAIQALIASIAPGAELFEKRDYLGTPIQTFKNPMPAAEGEPEKQVCYAFTDRQLILGIGGFGAVESVLAALAKPGASPWDREAVRDALAALPPGQASHSYADLKVYTDMIVETLTQMQMMTGEEICDPESKPEPGALSRHFGAAVSSGEVEPTRLQLVLRFLHATYETP